MQTSELLERRTAADMVFERLHEEIVSLAMLPGTKLSEVDVARRFGVSRQPVRDAFNRLDTLDLLLIRPQKATVVRGFSMERIAHARFVRLAVELEVVRRAAAVWDADRAAVLTRNLAGQQAAIAGGDIDAMHALDLEFHESICTLGGCPLSIETVRECKQKVDRLCRLSLGIEREPEMLLEDHRRLARALSERSAEAATAITREHLARLDDVITTIQHTHAAYFE
ncbi:MAG: GntR family transcriptional regulator [Pseudomonadota bacterium]